MSKSLWVLAGLAGLAAWWPGVATAELAIPLYGNLDPDEGTIEMWVKFAFEPLAIHDGFRSRGTLFAITAGDPVFPQDGLALTMATAFKGRRTRTQMECVGRFASTVDGRGQPPLWLHFRQDVKRDTWYHMAITWSRGRDQMTFYLDGLERNQTKYSPLLFLELRTGGRLHLGYRPGDRGRDHLLALDEVRISSIARPAAALGVHQRGPLEPDIYTLLLVSFDRTEQDAVIPDFLATALPGAVVDSLPLPAPARLIDGRHGRGLALTSQEWE